MIQRVQSIFFFLAALCFGGEFFTSLAQSSSSVVGIFADRIYDLYDHPALLAVCGLGALVCLAAIFFYKNRSLQKKLGYVAITLAILLPVVAILLFMNQSESIDKAGAEVSDSVGLYLPIGMIIFAALAVRGVTKDDKLVESMDRLR